MGPYEKRSRFRQWIRRCSARTGCTSRPALRRSKVSVSGAISGTVVPVPDRDTYVGSTRPNVVARDKEALPGRGYYRARSEQEGPESTPERRRSLKEPGWFTRPGDSRMARTDLEQEGQGAIGGPVRDTAEVTSEECPGRGVRSLPTASCSRESRLRHRIYENEEKRRVYLKMYPFMNLREFLCINENLFFHRARHTFEVLGLKESVLWVPGRTTHVAHGESLPLLSSVVRDAEDFVWTDVFRRCRRCVVVSNAFLACKFSESEGQNELSNPFHFIETGQRVKVPITVKHFDSVNNELF